MEILLVIPSSQRGTIIQKKTLSYLRKVKSKFKRVIVVDNIVEKNLYKSINPDETIVDCGGQYGIGMKRKWIRDTYSKTHRYIISMDDDIDNLFIAKNKKEVVEVGIDNFDELIISFFKKTEEENAHLWGISPYKNPYFASETSTYLKKICGGVHGYINDGIEDRLNNILPAHGEDYENTLLYFLEDNKVIRFNKVLILSKFYRPNGGLYSYYNNNEERNMAALDALAYLEATYPDMCKLIIKHDGKPDLRLNYKFTTM